MFCIHVLCHKSEVHVHSSYTLSCIYRLPLKITNKNNRNVFAPHPSPTPLDICCACCSSKTVITDKGWFISLCNKSVLLNPDVSWLPLFPAGDRGAYIQNLEECLTFPTDLENIFCLTFLNLRLYGGWIQETYLQVMQETILRQPVEISELTITSDFQQGNPWSKLQTNTRHITFNADVFCISLSVALTYLLQSAVSLWKLLLYIVAFISSRLDLIGNVWENW